MTTLLHHLSEIFIGIGVSTTTYWIAALSTPWTAFWGLMMVICVLGSAFVGFTIVDLYKKLAKPADPVMPAEQIEEN